MMPTPLALLLLFVAAIAPTILAQEKAQPGPAAETVVLEGRVVDMLGQGIPAAAVHASVWNDPTPLARTFADGGGYFRLLRVPLRASLLVKAEQDGYCVGVAYAGSRTRVVQIDLQHATTLSGTLRNRAGEPVAGAVVLAEPTGRSLTYVECETRIDASGRFEFRAVPLAPLRVSAWVEGEGLAVVSRHVVGPCEVALVPSQEATTTLQVKIDGLPESATDILLSLYPYRRGSMEKLPPPHRAPRIGRDGRWTLAAAPDLEYLVSPVSSEFAFAPREIRVEVGAGPHDLRFVAKAIGSAGLQCRAEVRGPDDKPIGGLPFVLRAPNGGPTATATSAADGTMVFSSPLAAGTRIVVYTTDPAWTVDQSKPADARTDRRALTQYETTVDPSATLSLRVVPACSIRGRVLLPDGNPLPFAGVELQEERSSRLPRWMPMSWVTADRDGYFRFEGRHHLDDAVRLLVQSPAGTHEGEPLAMAKPDTHIDAGNLTLAPPAVVEGVVRDAQKRPVPGVRVWLRDWDMARGSMRSGSVTETLTDREGRYRFLGVPIGGAYLEVLEGCDENPRLRRDTIEPFEVEVGKTHTHDLTMP